MSEHDYKYIVYCGDTESCIFNYLKDAMIYIQACNDEYYADPNWEYRIERFEYDVEDPIRCANCYYGQADVKRLNEVDEHCINCDTGLSEWTPLENNCVKDAEGN